MKNYLYTVLFIIFINFTFSCSEDDEMNGRDFIATCYKFVEKGSNIPITGLSLLINYGNSNLLGSQGYTDNEGEWCFDHWNDDGFSATPYLYVLKHEFYDFPSLLPMNGLTNTIELIPRSSIKFHIKDVEPISNYDRIDIYVSFATSETYGMGYSRPIEGTELDTTVVFNAIKGLNTIEWTFYTAGIKDIIHTDEVFIENYHDILDYSIEY